MRNHHFAAAALGAAILAAPAAAGAFCGFYVGGAGVELYNNATQVVLMRDGTRTVLSMQNSYQGPAEDFAMVVPVPVVLQKDDVKTLPREVFGRVDKLDAPRLVEYWEQDPCAPMVEYEATAAPTGGAVPSEDKGGDGDLGVKVEAKFAVGEYQIVILSATESTGLETWLTREKYNIPKGAAAYLQPYVAGGSKFFVAKVDIKKVAYKGGMAMLSPLRVAYDSEEFSLPIRLGMMNSKGTQDLIVHILARGKRYHLRNYPNVTIPTNIEVRDDTRKHFGVFYAALFDRTVEKNPRAVVTEYAWDAATCDPCPEPPLEPGEVATLGADVLGNGSDFYGFVLTRLHMRYAKDGIADDLVFAEAPAIVGGREQPGKNGKLEEGASPDSYNNFQARYIIRHPWTGAIACDNPRRGIWGGPPADVAGSTTPKAALDLAFVPRGGLKLETAVAQDVPEIGVVAGAVAAPAGGASTGAAPPTAGAPTGKEKPIGRSEGGGVWNSWAVRGVLIGAASALLLFLVLRRRTP